ncbi:MAG: Heterosigma akashiwo virus 01 [Cyanobacteriota bacterium]
MSYYIIFIICVVCVAMLTMFKKPISRCNDIKRINKLIRQTSRWAVAAEQDTNPYIANLHATYSLGYLMALREIYSDEYIKKLVKLDVRKLETEVTRIMDDAVKKLIQVCPEGQPKNKYLAFLAKEGQ